jgi:guanylate kinase
VAHALDICIPPKGALALSNTLYLISGPSGSGKTTLTQALLQRVSDIRKVVTVTTRLPRVGEINGLDYNFVSPQRFREMAEAGEFLETDYAFAEHYGIPKSAMEFHGEPMSDLAVIITVEGARVLRQISYSTHSIFIMPSDAGAAALRVAERVAPNQQARIAAYESEVVAAREYNAVILNLDFDQALDQLVKTVVEHRQSIRRGFAAPLPHKVSTAA